MKEIKEINKFCTTTEKREENHVHIDLGCKKLCTTTEVRERDRIH